jgi:hypothetical protein
MKGKTMITSEEAIELSKILYFNIDENSNAELNITTKVYKKLYNFITQQEELTTLVKRYFELKAKGITTEVEALEHRELLNKINKMVGIK